MASRSRLSQLLLAALLLLPLASLGPRQADARVSRPPRRPPPPRRSPPPRSFPPPRPPAVPPTVQLLNATAFHALWSKGKGDEKLGNITFLDVRPSVLYPMAHVPGARSVPLATAAQVAAKWASRREGISPDRNLACYCTTTISALLACQEFAKVAAYGYIQIYALDGGFAAWTSQRYPTATGSAPGKQA
ncbi:hypothetical protein HYH03_018199 [Edaphochlamys debaryana]|uniref:Rhodanese domain-containing protein n=1 Tax=Edaphochlamys debaryana TaxID=47281 RepID=A0A836BND3_9CHLO|nr:hypothetical protein HYH03_018199 [Edaphochlamys debaryana]|eukprot:KAG2482920.1 hypothetical protein HYH03_018199 [Edaphochlamys debaryana]